MSGQKRSRVCDTSDESSSSSCSSVKKQKVQRRTVEKWIRDYDKTLNTMLWLKFKMADRDHVSSLRCDLCSQFKDKLISMRNYRSAFVEGTTNVKTSSFKEHPETDMHAHATLLFKKQASSDVTEYAPIAQVMAKSLMDTATSESMKRKFDIAYMIAKENLAFTKMKPLCEIEERHGVMLGQGYKNDHGCSMFLEFIFLEQQQKLVNVLSQSNFFSVQLDSSTDVANVEDELFLVLYFDPFSSDGKVHIQNKYLCVRQLKCATADGIFNCFKKAMDYVGIVDWNKKMIGLGCDGTNVNIGNKSGVKALLKEDIPWVIVFWCLAHRLELSLKDSLKSTHFQIIDELLLQAYYLYEKSPKKCKQLEDIVVELKKCLDPEEMPNKGGSRPLRACGTRFIAHKVAALGRLIDRFGAYLNHVTALTEDTGVKASDRQKLKGYIQKWQKFSILLRCAFFHDLLRPAGILCKILQEDDLCVVRAIESVMKTKKALDKLKTTRLEELPSVSKVLSRIKQDNEECTYQGADIKLYDQGLSFVKSNYIEWVEAVASCLRCRIKTEHTELLTHAVTLLATNGWERSEDPSFGHTALDEVCSWFHVPLEYANIDSSLVREEWDDMVEYGKQYLTLFKRTTR